MKRLVALAHGYLIRGPDPETGEITYEKVSPKEVAKALDSCLDRIGLLPRTSVSANITTEHHEISLKDATDEERRLIARFFEREACERLNREAGAELYFPSPTFEPSYKTHPDDRLLSDGDAERTPSLPEETP